ncbi:MAG: tetratricopeptide repeat protein [Candidatus Omnitrophica bacterium]|nr:tetratricopeptide repeat protein [Candidatus Omnitrophota bacterium]
MKNKIIIIFMFILFINCLSFAGEEEDFAFAKRTFEDKFYEVAIKQFETFLKNYPESGKINQVHLFLAQCYYHLDKLLPALSELELIAKKQLEKELTEAVLYWLGEVYLKGKDFSTAREYFLKIINSFPESAYKDYALHALALSHYDTDDVKEAIFWWDKLDTDLLSEEIAQEVLMYKGKGYFKLGRYDSAKECFLFFINRFPKGRFLDEAYYYLGEISFRTFDYNDALDNYSKVILRFPRSSFLEMARIGIAWVYLETGRYEEAEKYFKNFIETRQGTSVLDYAFVGLANTLVKLNRYNDAIDVYEKIIKEFPESSHVFSAHVGKAECLYSLARYNEAIDFCKEAIRRFNRQHEKDDFYYTMGWAYRKLGKLDEAVLIFEDIVHYSNDEQLKVSSLSCLGDIYLEKEDYVKAQEFYDIVLKEYPGSLYVDYAQMQLGLIFYRMERYDAAIIALRNLILNFPSTRFKEGANYYLAMSYFKQRDYVRAEEEFAKLSNSSAYGEEAEIKRGVCLMNSGKYREAIDWFKKIRSIIRTDKHLLALDYYNAWAYYFTGKEKEFLKAIDNILKRYPDSDFSPDIIFWLGEYYYQKKDFVKAEEYFAQLVSRFPHDDLVDDVYYWLGWTSYHKKDFLASIRYFEKILDSCSGSPFVPEALYRKGKILCEMRMFSEAEDVFRQLEKRFPDTRFFYLALQEQASLKKDKGDFDNALILLRKGETCPLKDLAALIRFEIASLLEEKNNLDEALTEYLKIVYLEGLDNLELMEQTKIRIADILEKKGRWIEAEEIYNYLLKSENQDIKNLARKRLEGVREKLR